MTDAERSTEEESDEETPRDHPALTVTLKEARGIYNVERQRKESLENKAAAVGAISTSILLFMAAFQPLGDYFLGGAILPAVVSIFFCILALRLREYKQPHAEAEEFFGYARRPPAVAEDQFLLNYIVAIQDHQEESDKKLCWIRWAFYLLVFSLLVLTLGFVGEVFL